MAEIDLTRGLVAIVDDSDFAELSKYKWYAGWGRNGRYHYAWRRIGTAKNRGMVAMHRQILGLVQGDGKIGDHVNGMTLDNRRSNLRIADACENQHNRAPQAGRRFKGVSFHKANGKYSAKLMSHGKMYFFGYFATEEAADVARRAGAKLIHKEFAR